MGIYETDLPGVGKKFEIDLEDRGEGAQLVVVIHNTGKREVYRRDDPDADSEKLFELSDRLAREVGTILEGAYFQPISHGKVETVLAEGTVIEWVKVPDGSPVAGRTLQDVGVREATGASVIAIQRESGETIRTPGPDTEVAAGDTLVTIGDEGIHDALESMVAPDGA